MKQLYTSAILLALLIIGVSVYLWSDQPVVIDNIVGTLQERTIVDFGYQGDGTVAYSYLGERAPEKFAEDEVKELRTNSSYTRHVDTVVEDGEERPVLEARIYSQPAFAKDIDGSWKYLEYATTTEQAFRERSRTFAGRIQELFVRSAYAATISPFSEVGDGIIGGFGQTFSTCDGTAWALARDGATGFPDDTANTVDVYVDISFDAELTSCTSGVNRAFLPYNTSAIPSAATISAASLNVYADGNLNGDNDGTDYVTVVQTSQATHTELVAADYNNVNSATEAIDAGQRKDISSIGVGYITFTLNATGIGYVAKSGVSSNCSATAGITCLGLREGHDMTGSEPVQDSGGNSQSFYSSEQTGTSQDPYLEVTYTAPGGFAFWMFSDF